MKKQFTKEEQQLCEQIEKYFLEMSHNEFDNFTKSIIKKRKRKGAT